MPRYSREYTVGPDTIVHVGSPNINQTDTFIFDQYSTYQVVLMPNPVDPSHPIRSESIPYFINMHRHRTVRYEQAIRVVGMLHWQLHHPEPREYVASEETDSDSEGEDN